MPQINRICKITPAIRFDPWRRAMIAGLVGIGIAYILPEFGKLFPLLELFSHFKPHFALIAFGLGIIATLARCFKTGVLAFAMVAAIIVEIWPHPTEILDTIPHSNTIKVIDLNVLDTNPNPNAVMEFIRQEDATVVGLQEVTPAWQDRLRTLSDIYSFMVFSNDGLKCCIGLLSKIPWESVRSVTLSPKGPDLIHATFNMGDSKFSVVVTHLDPPKPDLFGYKFHHHHQTKVLGTSLQSFTGPFILVGDLNTTHWAPSFERITQGTTLKRITEDISPTWPAKYISVGIPVDHILATEEFINSRLVVGPDVQSDHLPLVAELTL